MTADRGAAPPAGAPVRPARIRWVALALLVLAALATLVLHGYVHGGVGGAATAAAPEPGPMAPGMAAAGPLLDLSGDVPRSLAIPPRTLALTFDDGPDPDWTPAILEVLARHGARASFFVLGSRVAEHPGIVEDVVAGGHDVASHTFTHRDVHDAPWWLIRLELSLTEHALAGTVGRHTALLRPPYSSVPEALTVADLADLRRLGREGYVVALTDLDSGDWQEELAVDELVRNATPPGGAGAVVLFHDGGGDRARTVAAVDRLLTDLGRQGYRFATVTEVMAEAGFGPSATPEVSTSERLSGRALVALLGAGSFVVGLLPWLMGTMIVLALLRAAVVVVLARRHHRRRAAVPLGEAPAVAVAVIVPAYNEAVGIEAAIRSIVATEHTGPLEVVVVDDGSTDATAEIVQALAAEPGMAAVRLISQPNAGKPAALNTGLAVSTAPFVVMVDGDTTFRPDTLPNVLRPFADPSVGAVAGNTKIGNRRGFLGRFQHIEYVLGFNLDRRAYEVLHCMPTVPGAIGAFRREVLEDIGGVSGDTLAEDTDLTMAVHRRDRRVVYEPTAVAFTEAPSRWRDLWRQRYRWSYGTMQAMWKHRHGVHDADLTRRRFARRALPYMLVFQVVLPLAGPFVDAAALYALAFDRRPGVLVSWLAFNALQLATGWYAFRLDGERVRPLWLAPLQQVVYRQVMYLVIWDAVLAALSGVPLRWHKLHRVGIGPTDAAA